MCIKIICIGKLKYDTFAKLASDYCKRLSGLKLEIVELNEAKVNDVNKKIESETSLMRQKLNSDEYNILLDAEGEQLTSLVFTDFLYERLLFDKITFVIGGAYGFQNEFKKDFDKVLSFGKMTFTHQFVRILLLEQLYRAWAIKSGKKYHY